MADKKETTKFYMVAQEGTGTVTYADPANARYITSDKDTAIAAATAQMGVQKRPYFVLQAVTKVEPIVPSAKITEL